MKPFREYGVDWITRDGRRMTPQQMDDNHLQNVVRHCLALGGFRRFAILGAFLNELMRRNLRI